MIRQRHPLAPFTVAAAHLFAGAAEAHYRWGVISTSA